MTYLRVKRSIVLGALLAIILPLSVQAGFFSSLGNLLTSEEQTTEETVLASAQSTSLLKAALHSDPNPAKGGGDILIEEGALVPDGDVRKDIDTESRTEKGEISVYVVREADTLSQIAEMFDVSSNTILWANDIKDPSVIQPGDTLVILPITGVRHVVKKGDTIASIAKKYEGDADEIVAYNRLAGVGDIGVGDIVVVPSGVMAAPVVSRGASSAVTLTGNGSAGFVHPLPGAVKTQGIHGYNGVDLAGLPAGTAVRAVARGTVIVAKGYGWNGGYGNYVVIRHGNGTQTLYAHLSSVSVSVGETVGAGETVGGVGNTGRSTGTHLHFEVRGARNPF
ncbi:M23 family metallopeptidase [Candidatus Kaiserbacteria bacterium]|nr:M23 family metallopeptidase [Candidatus Kaiserbacteria bacterium]